MVNKMNKEINGGGNPGIWMCFPCLFAITTCEVICKACCITICCIKPYSTHQIDVNDFNN